jgi:hypothetical protein
MLPAITSSTILAFKIKAASTKNKIFLNFSF